MAFKIDCDSKTGQNKH